MAFFVSNQVILNAEGIPIEHQRLTFCGKIVETHKTLDELGIRQENVLNLYFVDTARAQRQREEDEARRQRAVEEEASQREALRLTALEEREQARRLEARRVALIARTEAIVQRQLDAQMAQEETRNCGATSDAIDAMPHITVVEGNGLDATSTDTSTADTSTLTTTAANTSFDLAVDCASVTKSFLVSAGKDFCLVCMETFETGDVLSVMPCHGAGCQGIFHRGEVRASGEEGEGEAGCLGIVEWLHMHSACPLCRREVPSNGEGYDNEDDDDQEEEDDDSEEEEEEEDPSLASGSSNVVGLNLDTTEWESPPQFPVAAAPSAAAPSAAMPSAAAPWWAWEEEEVDGLICEEEEEEGASVPWAWDEEEEEEDARCEQEDTVQMPLLLSRIPRLLPRSELHHQVAASPLDNAEVTAHTTGTGSSFADAMQQQHASEDQIEVVTGSVHASTTTSSSFSSSVSALRAAVLLLTRDNSELRQENDALKLENIALRALRAQDLAQEAVEVSMATALPTQQQQEEEEAASEK